MELELMWDYYVYWLIVFEREVREFEDEIDYEKRKYGFFSFKFVIKFRNLEDECI